MGKICFISIKKDLIKFERLINSISMLYIPDDYEVDFIEVTAENGKATAYEEARRASDADINIYIDGEAEIIEKEIILKLLHIFEDNEIAVVGVLGTDKMPTNGVASSSTCIYGKYCNENGNIIEGREFVERYMEVTAVEGFFMAIRGNISWRSDLFKGENFYDTSQCLEYIRKGFKVVVAAQKLPWVGYERKVVSYNEDEQDIFFREYSKDIYPLVTVLIPTYQRPHFLELALKSVLSQTYKNIEIFITDNSKDCETKILMQKYMAEDNRIIYEYHPEYDRNENWKRAQEYDNPKAEYINWLMDDDMFATNKIEKMINFYLMDDSIALVTSYRQRIDENGYPLKDFGSNVPIVSRTSIIDGYEVGKELLKRCQNFIGEPTTVLIKKKLLKGQMKGWSGKEGRFLLEDYPIWLRLLQFGKFVYIREPLSFYRNHSGQDQNKPELIAYGAIAMAYQIQYAVRNKIYLVKTEDIKTSYINWMEGSLRVLRYLEENYKKLSDREMEDLHKLRDIFANMSLYIAGRCTSDFEVDVGSAY